MRSFLLAMLLLGCSRSSPAVPGDCGEAVTGEVARTLVASGARLVDVRTTGEHQTRHIAGSINIPVQELDRRMGEFDRSVPVVVYCRSGRRSADAAQRLCRQGYRAHNLGPMSAW